MGTVTEKLPAVPRVDMEMAAIEMLEQQHQGESLTGRWTRHIPSGSCYKVSLPDPEDSEWWLPGTQASRSSLQQELAAPFWGS